MRSSLFFGLLVGAVWLNRIRALLLGLRSVARPRALTLAPSLIRGGEASPSLSRRLSRSAGRIIAEWAGRERLRHRFILRPFLGAPNPVRVIATRFRALPAALNAHPLPRAAAGTAEASSLSIFVRGNPQTPLTCLSRAALFRVVRRCRCSRTFRCARMGYKPTRFCFWQNAQRRGRKLPHSVVCVFSAFVRSL